MNNNYNLLIEWYNSVYELMPNNNDMFVTVKDVFDEFQKSNIYDEYVKNDQLDNNYIPNYKFTFRTFKNDIERMSPEYQKTKTYKGIYYGAVLTRTRKIDPVVTAKEEQIKIDRAKERYAQIRISKNKHALKYKKYFLKWFTNMFKDTTDESDIVYLDSIFNDYQHNEHDKLRICHHRIDSYDFKLNYIAFILENYKANNTDERPYITHLIKS